MLSRAAVLASIALLSGCGRDAPEDAPVVAPGADIPMGAIGAVGVTLDLPTTRGELAPVPRSKTKIAPKKPAPKDPFESPPELEPPGKPPAKTPKGTAL